MHKINKNVILFIIMLFFLGNTYYGDAYEITPNDIACKSAVVIESETGKILFDKNAKQKAYPASTTKIITALIAIENLDLEKSITVPEDFQLVDGSSMYLLPGETFKVKELIQAVLIHSANDACVLLAIEISGSVDSFVELMNQKAIEIGVKDTHFVNPHGLHDDNHYTTAYDMAIIAREAMKNDVFRTIVGQSSLILPETSKTPEKRIYNNTNRFLWSNSEIVYKNQYIPIKYDIIDGIKTGYTLEAGNCLVASGIKNDMRLISVVYNSNGFEMYRDSRLILDYGFDNFAVQNIITAGEVIGSENIKHSIQKKVDFSVKQNVSNLMKKGENSDFEKNVKLNEFKLPIKKGDKIGILEVSVDGETDYYDLVALNDVESIFTFKYLKSLFSNQGSLIHKIIIVVIVILLLIILAFTIRFINIRRNRYRRYKKYKKY